MGLQFFTSVCIRDDILKMFVFPVVHEDTACLFWSVLEHGTGSGDPAICKRSSV